MLHIIDDLESMADTIYQISLVIDNKKKSKIVFTQEQHDSLSEFFILIEDAMSIMIENLKGNFKDVDSGPALILEGRINDKRNELRKRHVDDLKAKKYKHKMGVFYSDIFSLSEKLGDFVVNVSEAIDASNEPKKVEIHEEELSVH